MKRYPFSLLVLLIIIYLSFFRPPRLDSPIVELPGFDKIVHFCMYFGLSITLWWEYACSHRKTEHPSWQPWLCACLLPVAIGGAVEIMQSAFTDYRSGDWLDFAANTSGVVVASLIGKWLFPKILRRDGR